MHAMKAFGFKADSAPQTVINHMRITKNGYYSRGNGDNSNDSSGSNIVKGQTDLW